MTEETTDLLTDACFKVAERWLYNLTKWAAEIVVLEANLEDPSGKVTTGFGGIGGSGGGEPGDGTSIRATGLIEAETTLPELKRKVKVISAAINSLGYDCKQLVILKYIKGRHNQFIWEHLKLTGRWEFYRKRREAIDQIKEILAKDKGFYAEVENRVAKAQKRALQQNNNYLQQTNNHVLT